MASPRSNSGVELAAPIATAIDEGKDLVSPADHHDPGPAHGRRRRGVHGKGIEVEGHRPLVREGREGRGCDTYPQGQAEMTSDVAVEDRHDAAKHADDHRGPVLVPPSSPVGASVKAERRRAGCQVEEPDPPIPALGVGPLGQTGEGGGYGGNEAGAGKALRGRCRAPGTEEVEKRTSHPCPVSEVGEHRMEGVTQPRPREQPLGAAGPARRSHGPGQAVGQRVESALALHSAQLSMEPIAG